LATVLARRVARRLYADPGDRLAEPLGSHRDPSARRAGCARCRRSVPWRGTRTGPARWLGRRGRPPPRRVASRSGTTGRGRGRRSRSARGSACGDPRRSQPSRRPGVRLGPEARLEPGANRGREGCQRIARRCRRWGTGRSSHGRRVYPSTSISTRCSLPPQATGLCRNGPNGTHLTPHGRMAIPVRRLE
jgi:hypothetical protein